MNVVLLIVSFSLASLGFFLWRNGKFVKHPYPMFAWASLVEAMFFFSMFQNVYQCSRTTFMDVRVWTFAIFRTIKDIGFFDAIKIWGTEKWWNMPTTKIYYLFILKYDSNMFWFFTILSQGIDTLMNTMVFIDLYLSLSDPFKPREGRRKYYKTSILIVVVAMTFGLYSFWNDQFRTNK